MSMNVLEALKEIREGNYGPLPIAVVARLNEVCIHLGRVEAELEKRCRKMPPAYYEVPLSPLSPVEEK